MSKLSPEEFNNAPMTLREYNKQLLLDKVAEIKDITENYNNLLVTASKQERAIIEKDAEIKKLIEEQCQFAEWISSSNEWWYDENNKEWIPPYSSSDPIQHNKTTPELIAYWRGIKEKEA